MKLYFPNKVFTLEDILSGKINQKKLSQSESYVLNFIKQWHSDKASFNFYTSGSTGKPKEINLTRGQLIYSAESTLNYLFDKRPIRKISLCINPAFIGGTQVIVRALVANADLTVATPSSDALEKIDRPIDLVSMVPLQVYSELKKPNPFEDIDTVLIGGAEFDSSAERYLQNIPMTRFFHTYGMTETASHIALRRIGTKNYCPIGDIEIKLDDRSCLQVKGSVTLDEWITTNDVAEVSKSGFVWKGRADWVINSGGIKIHPEQIEKKIREKFVEAQILIVPQPDIQLGNRVVLVSKEPLLSRINASRILSEYEIPKAEYLIREWPLTLSGKVDRLAVINWTKNNDQQSL